MALWQYNFFILPQTQSTLPHASVESAADEDDFDDSQFWTPLKAKNAFDDIEGLLPQTSSWDKDIRVFGKIGSSCVTLCLEDDIVVSATLRTDS